MKDSNEPQLKRLKTWEAVKSARGDVTDVVSTKKVTKFFHEYLG